MPFEEGKEKTGGRQKGTPNRTSLQMREVMSQIHNQFLEQLEQDLRLMSPTNRWAILAKLAPYHMPTLSRNENSNTSTGQVTIQVEYVDNPVVRKVEGSVLNPLAITETQILDSSLNGGSI